ncbi:MAG: alpha/beta fold hydrolase [Deltaproteobacteria bacterium]|nr:alpha/beta fold hydrolase [Deltaproteobacteria bacterium]
MTAAAVLGEVESWRAEYPFASHWIDTPAGRQHYVDEGQGRPVLFVHGNPTWSFYWRRCIMDVSAAGFRAIAVDHLGCGLSDKPQDWSYRLADHVANLERLVVALDLRDITLVVHDWGGAIGLGVATRHPERFRGLVITNTAAFRAPRIPWRIAACRIPGLGSLAVRGLNGFAAAAVHMATEKGLSPVARAGLLAPYDSWHNRIATLRFVEDIPMAEGHPSWNTLAEIESGLPLLADKPMRLVWGEEDWCFTPWFRQEFERRFPAAQSFPLRGIGHYVAEDAADELSRHVLEAAR